MVQIPERGDPTLAAIDKILEQTTNGQPKRTYIGASSIGDPCPRKLWYRYHTAMVETFSADIIRKFNDGHRCEDVMAEHLRMVPGIQLWTHKEDGNQWGFVDGPFAGHYDGVILGLLQAPTTPHVWEHKSTAVDNYNKLAKLKHTDEKTALEKWNQTYYAQAVINMHKAGCSRHYLTVSTPGLRDYMSVRTEENPAMAEALIMKAKRIAESSEPPERIGGPDFYICKWCAFYGACHGA